MERETVENALERIEVALARIEAAASQPVEADRELQARHDRLRTAVAQSLRQLDELIAGQAQ